MGTSSIFLILASVNQSVTLSHAAAAAGGGGGVSFWGLYCDYGLLSLHTIDVSHRNAVKIISEIY